MHVRPLLNRIFRPSEIALLTAALGLAAGCNANLFSRPDFRSNYAPDRARAAISAAERGRTNAAPSLVNLLEDRDPTVRMYAQIALERLFGESKGYRYYDAESQRTAAVEQWRDAIRSGSLVRAERRVASARGSPEPAVTAGDDER